MNKMNPKTVTQEEYLDAQEEAVMGMVEAMRMLNKTEEDEEKLCIMLDLVLQVTTKIQGILFGEDDEDDDETESIDDECICEKLVVVDEEDRR